MKVKSEFYKGIEFIRISNLPADQKLIFGSFNQDKVIKILKEDTLIRDCIQYADYLAWLEVHYPCSAPVALPNPERAPTTALDLSLSKN
jgi:hypothetical protein